ncbi:MAG: MBL fold metallo-hydrolase [Deltaproteobacteria bacterium]|nr:MAG: MBL fold metallo-hydrolase [Deltaproteobacteria bacterium]
MHVQQLIVGMMEVCCYIVSCETTGKAVIIDPGGDEEHILTEVNRANLEVVAIINTHSHPDHNCGNEKIKAATGALIILHEEEQRFFNDPEVTSYFSRLGLPHSPPADRTVDHGDHLRFGKEALEVIHTPGHTPGGMCLYAAPYCFTGDTLFVSGVGRTDFPGGSMEQLASSIRERLFTLPPATIVYPGHGYGGLQSTIGNEANNPFF